MSQVGSRSAETLFAFCWRWMWLWPLSLMLNAGCVSTELERLPAQTELLRKQVLLGWRNSLCSRDARLLLTAVQEECENESCDTFRQEDIQKHVCSHDPKRRERFLEILQKQDREIFYLYSNSNVLSDDSRERLRSLTLDTPLLPTTRFLIVSRPWDKEADKRTQAERRGNVVRKELVQILLKSIRANKEEPESAIPDSLIKAKRSLLWVYEFPLNPLMRIRPASAAAQPKMKFENWGTPNVDASSDDERGVWVFRIDC